MSRARVSVLRCASVDREAFVIRTRVIWCISFLCGLFDRFTFTLSLKSVKTLESFNDEVPMDVFFFFFLAHQWSETEQHTTSREYPS